MKHKVKNQRIYFGTDGIRGKVGSSPINPEFMLHLAWAVGKVLLKDNPGKVLIGRDTRISGNMLESALQAGLNSAGVDVRILGPIPTPAIAHLTKSLRAAAGIVISASHNPFYDNGVKIFNKDGRKLSDTLEAEIEKQLNQPLKSVTSEKLGRSKNIIDAIPRYIEFCKGTFPDDLNLSKLKIVIDCANGASFYVAPSVLRELGATVIPIADQPNGININAHCGATDTRLLQKEVLKHKADVGIALDGDADRIMMVDHKGEVLDGDVILAILANDRKIHLKEKFGVVGTVLTNLGLEKFLAKIKVPFTRTKVGDRYVLEAMLKNKWPLGGETSGHVLCLDHITTGDGLITGLQVLAIMLQTKKSLHMLKKVMSKYPQIMINVPVKDKSIINKPTIKKAAKEIEKQLKNKGRLLLRPSGTEPMVRVMIEGEDLKQIQKLAKQLAAIIQHY